MVIVPDDKQTNISMVGIFICNYFIEKGKGIISKDKLLAHAAKDTLLFAVNNRDNTTQINS
ncbi:MAG: hypothetical protein IMY67_01870 [Bacteroidetes bacterium]|nr:hypothetical protein [Bacteroidota bacterium]